MSAARPASLIPRRSTLFVSNAIPQMVDEPAVEIAIRRERYRPDLKFLQAHEIAMLLKWSRRHHPLTARVQSMFFGWPWKASDAELLNLAQSLGGVSFRPAG